MNRMPGRQQLIALTLTIVTAFAASRAAAEPVDLSSPKAAVKSLYAAVARGDADAIKQVLVVDQDPRQQLVADYAGLIVAGKRLADVTRQKFPGTNNPLTVGTISTEDAAKVDAAALTMEGDSATLKLSGQPTPINLRKMSGGWHVLIGEGSGTTPQQITERQSMLKNLVDVLTQSADEISADKYLTVQDAENAVKERLGAVLAKSMQANPPTSRPATAPR